MNILNDKYDVVSASSTEIEQVQQEQTEYVLLGSFLRTKGLNIYYYDPHSGRVAEASIKYSDTIHVYLVDGKFITIDWEAQRCTVEGRFIYFEALNLKSATERVRRFKEGRIKDLANLKAPNPNGIKFF